MFWIPPTRGQHRHILSFLTSTCHVWKYVKNMWEKQPYQSTVSYLNLNMWFFYSFAFKFKLTCEEIHSTCDTFRKERLDDESQSNECGCSLPPCLMLYDTWSSRDSSFWKFTPSRLITESSDGIVAKRSEPLLSACSDLPGTYLWVSPEANCKQRSFLQMWAWLCSLGVHLMSCYYQTCEVATETEQHEKTFPQYPHRESWNRGRGFGI